MAVRPRFKLPQPLSRRVIELAQAECDTPGLPRRATVTTWGVPLNEARATIVYAGGSPTSAEEPALHSVAHGHDIYKSRRIHLVTIDKPGMGGTDLNPRFKIRRDFPRLVARVADELGVKRFAVIGISNGGPYAMAVLTAACCSGDGQIKSAGSGARAASPGTFPSCAGADGSHGKGQFGPLAGRVLGGAMVVGVSDVAASGYFSLSHPSGFFEGVRACARPCRCAPCVLCVVASSRRCPLPPFSSTGLIRCAVPCPALAPNTSASPHSAQVFNSLPLLIGGPLIRCALGIGAWALFGPLKQYAAAATEPFRADDARSAVRAVLADGGKNWGRGFALDSQQGLSPLYARPRTDVPGAELSAATAYAQVDVPVSLWYGKLARGRAPECDEARRRDGWAWAVHRSRAGCTRRAARAP